MTNTFNLMIEIEVLIEVVRSKLVELNDVLVFLDFTKRIELVVSARLNFQKIYVQFIAIELLINRPLLRIGFDFFLNPTLVFPI